MGKNYRQISNIMCISRVHRKIIFGYFEGNLTKITLKLLLARLLSEKLHFCAQLSRLLGEKLHLCVQLARLFGEKLHFCVQPARLLAQNYTELSNLPDF